MRYFGGKARIGKELAEIIQKMWPNKKYYWEPFCGACSVLEHIQYDNRRASDLHPDLILMWKALQEGWVPPKTVSEDLYNELKNQESGSLRGFVGFGCSNSGKWFGGYARDSTGNRNYARNAYNGVLKKILKLKDVEFFNENYKLFNPMDYVIYCDPPYMNTTKFSLGNFDSNEFWEWARLKSKDNIVIVSEYTAPLDFDVIWQKSVKTDMKKSDNTKHDRIEKLFKYNPNK